MEDNKKPEGVVEQYRISMELLRQSNLQRTISTYFFIGINTILLAIGFSDSNIKTTSALVSHLFIIGLGIILCFYWFQDMKELKKVNEARFRVAMRIEDQFFNFGTLRKEWDMLGNIPFRKEVNYHIPFQFVLPIIYLLGFISASVILILGFMRIM
jgi:hypothetical protein